MKEKRQKKIKPSRMAFLFRVREGDNRKLEAFIKERKEDPERNDSLLFSSDYLICWIKQSSMLGVMGAISRLV